MKLRNTFLLQGAGIIWFIILIVLTALLVFEYKSFKNELMDLVQLREDYQGLSIMLRRMIVDNERSKTETANDSEIREKKKINEDAAFMVVNRDQEYLRKAAISFARAYNLDCVVGKMYEVNAPKKVSIIKKKRRSYRSPRRIFPHLVRREVIFEWPIERNQFWLSSPYGPRKKGFHYGIDLAAVHGTIVHAAGAGIVVEAGYVSGYGNTIVIEHNTKFATRYAHLAKIFVHVGQRVKQCAVIGKVGDTGHILKQGKDGSHLHFEVKMYGKKVNPLYFLA
ncbi:MAG: M23 family metallopeptidase [Candidatus Babeliaceae bacterium]